MAYGIYETKLRDGSPSFRVSFYHEKKHIAIGSYPSEKDAQDALDEALRFYADSSITIENFSQNIFFISPDKAVSILNHRDNGVYFKTPIYLKQGYFLYFLKGKGAIKFDNDDLFYYSTHRILIHDGHLYVNDYGSQYSLLQRYGIRSYAVEGVDYEFANGDPLDLRYENVIVKNPYNGVRETTINGLTRYEARIHVRGYYLLGTFRTVQQAAVAYNKAVDLLRSHGSTKNYVKNYITEYSSEDYRECYEKTVLPEKFVRAFTDCK